MALCIREIHACLDVEVCDVARSMADLRHNFDQVALRKEFVRCVVTIIEGNLGVVVALGV